VPDAALMQTCALPRQPLPAAEDVGATVAFLSRAASYPDHPARVEVIETHFSWVFLTDRHAYKLKKPARGEGFDFRSVEARRRNALSELCLNRRLAGAVYLGVVPLVRTARGRLALGGGGGVVDWLIKMVRLDAARMLDRRLVARQWRRGDIEPIARHLAAFYATARRAPAAPPLFFARVRAEIDSTIAALGSAAETRLLGAARPVARGLTAFLVRRAGMFRRRLRDRRLVDGHGDLRPEHVYVNGTPRIIDCLEFRDDLRRVDPAGELAYLALECRRLGGPLIGPALLRRYRERTGDAPPDELVHFYVALNALIRARIAVRHLAEPGGHQPEELRRRATAYLAIAAAESRFLARRETAAEVDLHQRQPQPSPHIL
jgi:uncharacterized protein